MAASYISPSSIEVSDWLNLSHVLPSNDRPAASQSDVAEILSKRLRFKCGLPKGACHLRIIPTPWEVTLSKLLSIVSDFEREEHLKYKLA